MIIQLTPYFKKLRREVIKSSHEKWLSQHRKEGVSQDKYDEILQQIEEEQHYGYEEELFN